MLRWFCCMVNIWWNSHPWKKKSNHNFSAWFRRLQNVCLLEILSKLMKFGQMPLGNVQNYRAMNWHSWWCDTIGVQEKMQNHHYRPVLIFDSFFEELWMCKVSVFITNRICNSRKVNMPLIQWCNLSWPCSIFVFSLPWSLPNLLSRFATFTLCEIYLSELVPKFPKRLLEVKIF